MFVGFRQVASKKNIKKILIKQLKDAKAHIEQ